MATPLASLLDPSEISSEVLFATIMALSVTASWVGARPLRMGFLFSGLGGVVAAACIALGG